MPDISNAEHVSSELVGASRTFTTATARFYFVLSEKHHLGRDVRKPVFGVSDIVKFKAACSATGTSQKIEILLVASFDMVLSKERITNALIRLRGCAGWSAPLLISYPRRQVFSQGGPSNMLS